jgi:PDZ and LIM domain protein 5/6/7
VNPSVLGRPSEDEESEFGGLAYAEGDNESDDDELLARGMVSARVHHSPSVSSTYSDDHPPTERASKEMGIDKALAALLRSPTSTDTPLSPASSTKHIRASKPPMRSLTSHVRDPPAQVAAIVRRGATISGAYSGPSDMSRNDRSSQESITSGLAKHREKALTCLQCSKDIEDKRWISVENGRGVLCDKCWKNMYLPKVREVGWFWSSPLTIIP